MQKILVITVILGFSGCLLTACSKSLDRGLSYCQDNYFGYSQLRCEQQIRAQNRR